VAAAGTGATMRVLAQLVVRAAMPLKNKLLALVPTVGPKFVPATLTTVPIGPAVGLMLLIFGGGVTVKARPLLATPFVVTMTFPVVAPAGTVVSMDVSLQLMAVASVPFNVTVLDPCDAPKFTPVIVRLAPTGPCERLKFVRLGPAEVTVKAIPLLATPPAVTTTFPLIAPLGTGAVMLLALQPVGVVARPLNVTVLLP